MTAVHVSTGTFLVFEANSNRPRGKFQNSEVLTRLCTESTNLRTFGRLGTVCFSLNTFLFCRIEQDRLWFRSEPLLRSTKLWIFGTFKQHEVFVPQKAFGAWVEFDPNWPIVIVKV